MLSAYTRYINADLPLNILRPIHLVTTPDARANATINDGLQLRDLFSNGTFSGIPWLFDMSAETDINGEAVPLQWMTLLEKYPLALNGKLTQRATRDGLEWSDYMDQPGGSDISLTSEHVSPDEPLILTYRLFAVNPAEPEGANIGVNMTSGDVGTDLRFFNDTVAREGAEAGVEAILGKAAPVFGLDIKNVIETVRDRLFPPSDVAARWRTVPGVVRR